MIGKYAPRKISRNTEKMYQPLRLQQACYYRRHFITIIRLTIPPMIINMRTKFTVHADILQSVAKDVSMKNVAKSVSDH